MPSGSEADPVSGDGPAACTGLRGPLLGTDALAIGLRLIQVGTGPNAGTSRWRGTVSGGSGSRVRQLARGHSTCSFSEDWYEDLSVISTVHSVGTGRCEPSTVMNIHTSPHPMAAVVVACREDGSDGQTTADTGSNSTCPARKVGETITDTMED